MESDVLAREQRLIRENGLIIKPAGKVDEPSSRRRRVSDGVIEDMVLELGKGRFDHLGPDVQLTILNLAEMHLGR